MQDRSPPLNLLKVQNDLEALYRIQAGAPVDQFLLTSEEFRRFKPENEAERPSLLIQEREEELLFGVHLGEELIRRFETAGPGSCGLQDLCTVSEEISHFLYLTWHVQNDRPVSLLDVELQGEIDKFLVAANYLSDPEGLVQALFAEPAYHENLDEESLGRYREANRLGAKFCRFIAEQMAGGGIDAELLGVLRAFYRRTPEVRLSQVELL